ncbi:MAG: LPS export ABC transporter permease LptF [Burkholderiales bacterium]|nr:LPS export ABC transporter permease LptF [Burkholderiales bacterium]
MTNYPRTVDKKSKRRLLFDGSVQRELSSVAFAVFAVLIGIVVVTQLSRLLGEAASGTLAAKGVIVLLGFSALNYLPVLLSLTLFISVLLTLTRSYQDSEMTVWFVSGVSLVRWVRPVLSFSIPFIATIAILSFTLTPWALSQSGKFKKQLESREEMASIAPGVFRESKQADRVYFFEPGQGNRVGNIFVQSTQNQKVGTMVASSGYQEMKPNGDRFLVLLDGTRYEGDEGALDYRIMHFGRYEMRIEASRVKPSLPEAKALPTAVLLQGGKPAYVAELGWRVGMPLSALLLALLAIPLSFVNPRAGRSLNILMAILIYMIYNNLLGMTNVWVTRQKVDVFIGLWGVHIGMLAILLALFYWRLSVFSLFRRKR